MNPREAKGGGDNAPGKAHCRSSKYGEYDAIPVSFNVVDAVVLDNKLLQVNATNDGRQMATKTNLYITIAYHKEGLRSNIAAIANEWVSGFTTK